MAEHVYNTYKSASEVLIGSLLQGTNINYLVHKACIHRSSADRQKHREYLEIKALNIRKELIDGAGLNRLRWAAKNGAWLTATPQRLNRTELSREEFRDNLLIQYDIVPLKLPTDCDGCGNKFLVPHDLSCPKGDLVLAWNNKAAKEWGSLSAQNLKSFCISYKPKINSRTIQDKSNRSASQIATEGQEYQVTQDREGEMGKTTFPNE